ncbi:hypothetical protein PC129_g25563, partial [Phytophthora cactorum]
ISDPATTRGHGVSHSSYGAAGSIPNGSDVLAEKESSTKKRKRDEPDASDPKLREFLQVMKQGREGALDNVANTDVGDLSVLPGTAVPEEESDDEYEQIPAPREKQRRIDPPEQTQASSSQPAQLMEIDAPSGNQTPAPAESAEPSES